MFDGNHRSRRQIDLGGRRRNRSTRGASNFLKGTVSGVEDRKALVLENSRIQREERRIRQLQQKSSKIIQALIRGWMVRRRLVKEIEKAMNERKLSIVEISMLLSLKPRHAVLYVFTLENDELGFVARQRILFNALGLLENDGNCQHVVNLLEDCMSQSSRLSMPTFEMLVTTCQRWMSMDVTVAKKLWHWACLAGLSLEGSRPLLGVTLFHAPNALWDDFKQTVIRHFQADTESPNKWIYDSFTPFINSRDLSVIKRSVELYKSITPPPSPKPLLRLLDSCLSSKTFLLASIAVRGEKITGNQNTALGYNNDDQDSSDEEQHDDKRNKSDSRLTRQQLQTIARLDRLYKDDYNRLRQEAITNPTLESRDLAEQLSDSSLWHSWGIIALSHEETAPIYLSLLHRLLQGCCGSKLSTVSPFLSDLAISHAFLEKVWKYSLFMAVNGDREKALVAFAVFSDLFSHHLVALSDTDFLNRYTPATGVPTISAEAVIENLKNELYGLYWGAPVVASNMRVASDFDALRGRLLLSGTKLWNSLYERWCRLVHKSPFCEESIWWFPTLAARDDDGAVIGSREVSMQNDDDDSIRSMEIDDSNHNKDTENDALADSFRDPKMARVLSSIPQALPFSRRVKLFHSLLNADKLQTQDETAEIQHALLMMERGEDHVLARQRVKIRRDNIYTDSKNQLDKMGRNLKRRVQVSFVNQHGAEEPGIDGGGVFKEFLDDLIKQSFLPSTSKTGEDIPALFKVTPLQTLAVNTAVKRADALSHYEFLGRVLGKAVYESILVEPQFCLPFLNQLLGKLNSLEDLKNLDDEFYMNLMKLRKMSENEIDSLGLTFETTLGNGKVVPLIAGGADVSVTKQNVIQYVHLVAHRRLNVEGGPPTRSFLRGFRDLISASWVRLFSAHELQKIISGDDTIQGFDVASLKRTIVYAGGYHPSQPIIQWFWEIVDEFSPTQQRGFLRFMTSCSRQPLLGFQALDPVPCIQQVHLPDALLAAADVEKKAPLPTSSTCMNLLKLPNYRNKELMKKKLIGAIESGAGFELS